MSAEEPTVQPTAPAAPPSAMPPTLLPSTASETGGVLTIDLAAVEANWKKLYGMTVPVECPAGVKAATYGPGPEPAPPRLAQAGAPPFFFAPPAEGRPLPPPGP